MTPITKTTEKVCPGWRTDGTFNTDGCYHWDDETGDQTVPLEADCRCTTDCGDPGDSAGCCYCNHTDIYEPCPVVGYGCGMDARPYIWAGSVKHPTADRCDCCTDEQWAAASTPSAATLAATDRGVS